MKKVFLFLLACCSIVVSGQGVGQGFTPSLGGSTASAFDSVRTRIEISDSIQQERDARISQINGLDLGDQFNLTKIQSVGHGILSLPPSGFIPIYFNASGQVVLASNGSATTIHTGYVTEIISADSLKVLVAGYIEVIHNLTVGTTYFLGAASGSITTIEPGISAPVCVVISDTKILLLRDRPITKLTISGKDGMTVENNQIGWGGPSDYSAAMTISRYVDYGVYSKFRRSGREVYDNADGQRVLDLNARDKYARYSGEVTIDYPAKKFGSNPQGGVQVVAGIWGEDALNDTITTLHFVFENEITAFEINLFGNSNAPISMSSDSGSVSFPNARFVRVVGNLRSGTPDVIKSFIKYESEIEGGDNDNAIFSVNAYQGTGSTYVVKITKLYGSLSFANAIVKLYSNRNNGSNIDAEVRLITAEGPSYEY